LTFVGNLVLLCSRHHTLVHEGGFRIEKDFQNRWCFVRPDGIAVPDCGYHPRGMDADFEAYDLPPAGGLLSIVEKHASEPPPPDYLH